MYTVWAALYVCLHPPVSLNGNRVCLDEDTLRSGENHKLGTYRYCTGRRDSGCKSTVRALVELW